MLSLICEIHQIVILRSSRHNVFDCWIQRWFYRWTDFCVVALLWMDSVYRLSIEFPLWYEILWSYDLCLACILGIVRRYTIFLLRRIYSRILLFALLFLVVLHYCFLNFIQVVCQSFAWFECCSSLLSFHNCLVLRSYISLVIDCCLFLSTDNVIYILLILALNNHGINLCRLLSLIEVELVKLLLCHIFWGFGYQ